MKPGQGIYRVVLGSRLLYLEVPRTNGALAKHTPLHQHQLWPIPPVGTLTGIMPIFFAVIFP
jgi:hypothetical protein